MDYFTDAIRNKYADFSGRARRAEYWWFWLFSTIIVGVVALVDIIIGLGFILYGLAVLALIVPGIAVAVRRLHDTDRSGWWYLIALIPFGGIVLLVFMLLDGTPGPNKYGASPKHTAAPAA